MQVPKKTGIVTHASNEFQHNFHHQITYHIVPNRSKNLIHRSRRTMPCCSHRSFLWGLMSSKSLVPHMYSVASQGGLQLPDVEKRRARRNSWLSRFPERPCRRKTWMYQLEALCCSCKKRQEWLLEGRYRK